MTPLQFKLKHHQLEDVHFVYFLYKFPQSCSIQCPLIILHSYHDLSCSVQLPASLFCEALAKLLMDFHQVSFLSIMLTAKLGPIGVQ